MKILNHLKEWTVHEDKKRMQRVDWVETSVRGKLRIAVRLRLKHFEKVVRSALIQCVFGGQCRLTWSSSFSLGMTWMEWIRN